MFFKCRRSVRNVQGALEELFQWFSANHLVENAKKCHLLTSSKITNNIAISNTNVSSEQKVTLLGINLESRLNFVNTCLNKANKKYHALARVCNYMRTNKRRVLMEVLITSQLSYCPLVWMFHSRTMNNTLHKRALRLVYTNKPNFSFDDLLKENKSRKIHQKSLQILATEIYKVKKDLGPKIMADIFHFVEKPYNLRKNSIMQRQANRTVYLGTESISSLAPKLWELIPSEIKSAKSLNIFKEKIKSWTTDKCPCRVCKTYDGNIGFI